MRPPHPLGGALLVCASIAAALMLPGDVAADGVGNSVPDDGASGEQADVAVPISEADLAEQEASVPSRPIVRGPAATSPIDDFRYDEQDREGTASEICSGRIRRGTMWTFQELTSRFGGSAGSMYVCRERWDLEDDPDCNGTVVDPVEQPNFFSTCWSNHAAGRALDIMVGSDGSGYNTERGRAIVRWLLAPDAAGNQNARARRLGVQQILFNDRCWDSDGDRGIAWWGHMRRCGIGHHDHLHIDLTLPGATGNVSWWGATPKIGPKLNSLLSSDADNATWSVRRFVNLRGTRTHASTWDRRWQEAVAGDWDGDRRVDDVLLWNPSNGAWAVRTFSGSRSYFRGSGTWAGSYDRIVAGDLNADGRLNELFMYRRSTGRWQVQRWEDFRVARHVQGGFKPVYDQVMSADLDGDGRQDELLIWDVDGRQWRVKRFAKLSPRDEFAGDFGAGWNRIFAGDFDSDGEFDEAVLWKGSTGDWKLQDWAWYRPWTIAAKGRFARSKDDLIPVDADTDGRLDDAIVRDTETGDFTLHRWHANRRETIRTGTWSAGIESVVAGTWD